MEIIFWAFATVIAYVYVGYPLLLRVLVTAVPQSAVPCDDAEQSVTLIVSAFNEADVIAEKIENCLSLDYPREFLDVLVVSDASDDGTDDIVSRYSDQGVRLLPMTERGGKTVGLNAAAEEAIGDILVFSDANAMYREDAIRALVRNFSDSNIGAAVGESTYTDAEQDAEKSESAYWRYETMIKRLESHAGSVVGGDGAIYAIRREYYRPMAADALSDFVNPLQIVRQGKRCVYEPDAISVEKAAGSFDKEFRRKVRIVNRAWRATMAMKGMLNPFRHGFFSIQLISHKVLRWLVPFFLAGLFVANIALLKEHVFYQVVLMVQALFYILAIVGAALQSRLELAMPLYIPFYFCLVNIASIRGIIEAYQGKTYTTWSTARSDAPDVNQ